MASALTSAMLQVIASAELTKASGRYNPALQFQSGLAVNSTSNNGVDLIYTDDRTIASSGSPDTIDLTGVLYGPGGDATNFVEIVGVVIRNNSSAQILTVGAGSNPFIGWLGGTTPTIKIGKSGVFANFNPVDGWAVTAATGDIITVNTDGGTNVSYSVFIFGRSA